MHRMQGCVGDNFHPWELRSPVEMTGREIGNTPKADGCDAGTSSSTGAEQEMLVRAENKFSSISPGQSRIGLEQNPTSAGLDMVLKKLFRKRDCGRKGDGSKQNCN